MDDAAIRYLVLRDDATWDATVVGLTPDADGALVLRDGARSGTVESSWCDAGEGATWLRLRVDAEVPDGARVLVAAAMQDDLTATPDDQSIPSLDSLLSPPRRYLRVRITIESSDGKAAPRLLQVEAQTAGRSYLEDLPAYYRRRDQSGFLGRLLELFRAKIEDVEHDLDGIAHHFDPRMAPRRELAGLADWIAFDPPPRAPAQRLRHWLEEAWIAYGRRGTLAGLADAVALRTGVRPQIVEAWRERHLWVLGGDARLGIDTGLAPSLPDGMAVPGPTSARPSLAGLRREEFSDVHLLRPSPGPAASAIDARIEQTWPDRESTAFSVRWTGQMRPAYSEIYTLQSRSRGGVRVRVDEQLVIDHWLLDGEDALGFIRLEAGRWYAIAVEYFHAPIAGERGIPSIQLFWSSPSQRRELLRAPSLYAELDDAISAAPRDPFAPPPDVAIVGETVVGEHGPLDPAQLGEPLFADTAYRFTLRFPAAHACDEATRETIRQLVEREKPAHTEAHVCFVEPRFLVGAQAQIGIDAIVSGEGPRLVLGEAELGVTATVDWAGEGSPEFRVGQRDRVGRDTKLE